MAIIELLTAVLSLVSAYISFRTAQKTQKLIEQQKEEQWRFWWRRK
ncbi:hypothetical protein [Adonisia turfae]|nr:hypothetical protein [Adonisia turfae]